MSTPTLVTDQDGAGAGAFFAVNDGGALSFTFNAGGVGNGNTCLFVDGLEDAGYGFTVTGWTFNAISLTQATPALASGSNNFRRHRLVAPATGSHTLAATLSGTVTAGNGFALSAFARVLQDVDQTTPLTGRATAANGFGHYTASIASVVATDLVLVQTGSIAFPSGDPTFTAHTGTTQDLTTNAAPSTVDAGVLYHFCGRATGTGTLTVGADATSPQNAATMADRVQYSAGGGGGTTVDTDAVGRGSARVAVAAVVALATLATGAIAARGAVTATVAVATAARGATAVRGAAQAATVLATSPPIGAAAARGRVVSTAPIPGLDTNAIGRVLARGQLEGSVTVPLAPGRAVARGAVAAGVVEATHATGREAGRAQLAGASAVATRATGRIVPRGRVDGSVIIPGLDTAAIGGALPRGRVTADLLLDTRATGRALDRGSASVALEASIARAAGRATARGTVRAGEGQATDTNAVGRAAARGQVAASALRPLPIAWNVASRALVRGSDGTCSLGGS